MHEMRTQRRTSNVPTDKDSSTSITGLGFHNQSNNIFADISES